MNTLTFASQNIAARCQELFRSGRQAWWMVTDEVSRCELAIKAAATELSKLKTQMKYSPQEIEAGSAVTVGVVSHDQWAGLYRGHPTIQGDPNTSPLAEGLKLAIMTKEEIESAYGTTNVDLLPFDPADDLIFVFKSIENVIHLPEETQTVALLRDVIQVNMCSPSFIADKAKAAAAASGSEAEIDEETGHYKGFTRGSRMLVFITATTEMPKNLPELKPEIIPLPGFDALKVAALDILEPLWESHKESGGTSGVKKCSDAVLSQVVNAMTGLTLADAEEALTLALVRHGGMSNLDEFLDTIEKEKAKAIASIPGLTYIPKEQIVNEVPPGYEPLIEQLEDFIDEDGNVGLRGVSLGGPPGVAKTVTAKFIARYLKRIGLLLDVGATKGGIVGESEKNIRRVLQIADALMAVLVLDDIDKGGMNHGSGYGGDGGTTGNMIQAMLTMMSDPFCRIVFVFTFNRVPELPELLRFGRVDIRVYVEEPKNQPTRLGIFQYGLRQFGVDVDSESALADIAGPPTNGMTGAEIIHGIIKPAVMRAKKSKKKVVDTKFMRDRAGSFTPMLQQAKYAADLARLREDCSQFTKIGNLPDNAMVKKKPAVPADTGKSNRAVAIL
jgi:hypothetical protein